MVLVAAGNTFTGTVPEVSLKSALNRTPLPRESTIVLGAEMLQNPVFKNGFTNWNDVNGHWSYDATARAAKYDGSTVFSTLSTTSVSVTAGWYRLSVTTSAGATGTLEVEVTGVSASLLDTSLGRTERYFKLTSGVKTITAKTANLVGFVTSISLQVAVARQASQKISLTLDDGGVVAYEVRIAVNPDSGKTSILLGKDAGLYAFNLDGCFAIGNNSLKNGGYDCVVIGADSAADLIPLNPYEGSRDNTSLGFAALQGVTTGDRNIAIGKYALYNTAAENDNLALGNGAGSGTTATGGVFIGTDAGLGETVNEMLHIGSAGSTLIRGSFPNHNMQIGFTNWLTAIGATVDIHDGFGVRPSLRFRGGYRPQAVTKTTTYTVTINDYLVLCNATAGVFTLTLPTATSVSGQVFEFISIGTGGADVTIDGNGAETINGVANFVLANQYEKVRLYSTGTEYLIL